MRKSKIKTIVSMLILTGMLSFTVATAWATVTMVNTEQPGEAIKVVKNTKIAEEPVKGKANAPEPSTLALFGGGIISMIISFIRKTYAIAKRTFDIVASVFGMIILAPLLLIVAVLIKMTSKGPIVYSQVRVGKDGEPFRIFKFRTMKTDAEKETGPIWAAENDNRLTPIGGFLRKAHIDEIPQLVNVLKGDMSIIGPRPERPVFVSEFKEAIPDYEKRLLVKPGITGLAQVWHRYDETIQDVKKKLKYDLLYIKKMCFWADLSIIFRTFRVVITGEGAR